MRRLLALMALCVLVVATAQAQRGGGGFGGGFAQSPAQLLANKSVQEELKLTDEQKDKLKTVGEKIAADMKGAFAGGAKLGKDSSKEDREKAMAKFQEVMKENNAKAMKEIAPILKPEQLTRLKQIERQQMRMNLFTDAEFVKEVGITEEQKEKLKSISEESGKDSREIMSAVRAKEMDWKDGLKKVEAVNKDAMEKAMELMKDDQKAKYKTLVGEPFELKMEFGGGFGGGKGKNPDKDK